VAPGLKPLRLPRAPKKNHLLQPNKAYCRARTALVPHVVCIFNNIFKHKTFSKKSPVSQHHDRTNCRARTAVVPHRVYFLISHHNIKNICTKNHLFHYTKTKRIAVHELASSRIGRFLVCRGSRWRSSCMVQVCVCVCVC